MTVALASFAVQRRRESPLREWVRGQSVIFATRAAVLIHARGTEAADGELLVEQVGRSFWCIPAASK